MFLLERMKDEADGLLHPSSFILQRADFQDGRLFDELFQVRAPEHEQPVQFLLLFPGQPREDGADLVLVDGKDTADKTAAVPGEADLLGAQVGRRAVADDEAGALQAIDEAGNAGRPNEQAVAEFRQSQLRQAVLLGTMQVDQYAPLRAADAEAGEVGLHDTLDQTESANQFAEGVLGWPGAG